jgi:signal transduction histidine kinase
MTSGQRVSLKGSEASPSEASDRSTQAQRLAQFQLAMVMGAGRAFSPVYLIFAVAAVMIIYPGVSSATSLIWITVYLVYTLLRTVATTLYHADPERTSPLHVRRWRWVVFASALSHGLILGSLAIIAFPTLSPARQLVLTCFALLVTTGAVLYVSALLGALMALISSTLLPFILVWALQGKTSELPIAWFLVVAWIVNLFLSWTHHRSACRIFGLAADNEALVHALERKNRQLEAADRARVHLLAVTSHDLRQPVHALGLILAQVSEYDTTALLKQDFERLRGVSELISEMLLELMDLSKLESHTHVPRAEAIALAALLRQLQASQEPIAKRKGLSMNMRVDEDVWVKADPQLLKRMLLNLISNAIRYTAVGQVSVDVSAADEPGMIVIRVRDTGIGMPQERLDDIFRPYVRLNASGVDREGMGLGLAIVRRAADLQGLDIQVRSQLGVGSVFVLTLPSARPQIESLIIPADDLPSVPSNGTLIAAIDDDPFAREALMALLRRWGYSAASGATTAELLEALEPGDEPALIITDHHLGPFEFGTDAILNIRRRFGGKAIPAILITGDTEISTGELVNVEVAYKPLNPLALKRIVVRMICQFESVMTADT